MAVRPVSEPSSTTPPPVPKLVTGPIWSLQPWPVEIEAGGHQVTIPALTAADWLAILMVGGDLYVEDVVPGLLGDEDQAVVEEALDEGILGVDELHELSLDVIGTVSGRPWWVSLRLIETARSNWDVIGPDLALHGIEASRVSLSSWLDVATVRILANMRNEDATMWLMQLEAPPAGEEAPEPEVSVGQFLSMR